MRRWTFGAVALLAACGGSTSGPGGESSGSGARAGVGSRGGAGGAQGRAGGAASTGGAEPSAGGAPDTGSGGGPRGIGPFYDAGGPCQGAALSLPPGTDVKAKAYVLVEASSAMNGPSPSGRTWWEETAAAMRAYAADRRFRTATNALQFYPDADADAGGCSGNYEVPAVPPTLLSEAVGKIGAAFEARAPRGENAPAQAMSTAHAQLRAYLSAMSLDRASLVLVTRSKPSDCPGTSLSGLAQVESTSFPSIRTHVIVLGDDVDVAPFDAMAMAGGTDSARVLPGKDLGAELGDAMVRVRYPELGCTYELPAAYFARRAITVYATPEAARTVPVPFVDTAEDCETNGGVVFDDASGAPRITLCPETCARFAGASISATLACNWHE